MGLRVVRKFSLLVVGILTTTLFAASAHSVAAKDAIIALEAPISGPDAPLADPVVKGYQLAIKHANQRGDLPGKVIASIEDDQDKPEVGTTVARKLCGDEEVVGVVGSFASSINLSTGPIFEECGLVRISPTSSNNSLTTKGWKSFFRTASRNVDMISEGLKWIKSAWPQVRSIVTIDANDASTKDASAQIAEMWKNGGGTVLDQVHVTSGAGDYRAAITSLVSLNPDMVYLVIFDTDGGLFVKQARQLGYKGLFFGTDGIASPNFVDIGGASNVEGVHLTNLGLDPTKLSSAAEFVKAYQAEYNELPSAYSANAYDATMILVEAWKTSGGSLDRKAVLDAVKGKTFQGTFGPISFTPEGDLSHPAIGIYKFLNGKMEFVGSAS